MNVLCLVAMRPRKLGTVEEYCLSLADALTKRGDGAFFLFSELPPDWLLARFHEVHGVVEALPLGRPLFAQCAQLATVARRYKIDLAHLTFVDLYSSWFPSLKTAGGTRAVIFSDQFSRFRPPRVGAESALRRGLKTLRGRSALQSVDLLLADAEFIRSDLIETDHIPPSRIRVVYNGVNLDRFHPAERIDARRETLNIADGRPIVTTVAKCIPQKGLDVFLRAAAAVLGRHPDAVFCIVGDGPMLSDLQELAESLGIAPSVRFLGLRNDVERILQATDIFALCSLWREAFAFSLLEAMASGCPIVASRIGAIPESVTEGEVGFLVDPGAADQFAAAICRLIEDGSLRASMSRAARERVRRFFSMQQWVDNTLKAYQDVLT